MARMTSDGRLRKRPANKNRPSKMRRRLNRMVAAGSAALNPLRWKGLVPKSVALMDHSKPRNYGTNTTQEDARRAR
jgi:hypothetical protein